MAARPASRLTAGRLATGRLTAASRIRKRSEFREVQAHAARVVTRHFVFLLHMAHTTSAPALPRLGITASRKVGNAVFRNRAKRLVREAFRSTRDLWSPGVDVVVIVKTELQGLKLNNVVSEWRAAAPLISRATERSRATAHSRGALAATASGAL